MTGSLMYWLCETFLHWTLYSLHPVTWNEEINNESCSPGISGDGKYKLLAPWQARDQASALPNL